MSDSVNLWRNQARFFVIKLFEAFQIDFFIMNGKSHGNCVSSHTGELAMTGEHFLLTLVSTLCAGIRISCMNVRLKGVTYPIDSLNYTICDYNYKCFDLRYWSSLNANNRSC